MSLKINLELISWGLFLVRNLPGGVGVRLRSFIYKRMLRSCGNHLTIQEGCIIKNPKNIILGNNVILGLNNQIYAFGRGNEFVEIKNDVGFNSNVMVNANEGGSVIIGNKVIIGPNVVIRASDHRFGDINISIREQGHNAGRIIIEDDVWIGANAVILRDVVIGKGSIVAAGAVVTKNVDRFSVVGGVPAKVISLRN